MQKTSIRKVRPQRPLRSNLGESTLSSDPNKSLAALEVLFGQLVQEEWPRELDEPTLHRLMEAIEQANHPVDWTTVPLLSFLARLSRQDNWKLRICTLYLKRISSIKILG